MTDPTPSPDAWQQFMAHSGLIDLLGIYFHDEDLSPKEVAAPMATEATLRAFHEALKSAPTRAGRKDLLDALGTLFGWWEEYQSGAAPGWTYHARKHLGRMNLPRGSAGSVEPTELQAGYGIFPTPLTTNDIDPKDLAHKEPPTPPWVEGQLDTDRAMWAANGWPKLEKVMGWPKSPGNYKRAPKG